jgi:hypothetical protein
MTTQEKINGLKRAFGRYPFTKQELENPVYALPPLQTLYDHDLIQNVTVEHKMELTVDDLIADLNCFIGEDNYNIRGEYRREGDKFFFVTFENRYKFI